MLSRRQLRIKVMLSLYSYFMIGNDDLSKGEKQLLFSIEKINDLYFYLLLLILEVVDFAKIKTENNKLKRLPSHNDLFPNTKFIDNKFIQQLSVNKTLKRESAKRNLGWQDQQELVKKIYSELIISKEYNKYLASEKDDYNFDRDFIVNFFKNQISELEFLHFILEEKSLYWVNDIEFICSMIGKTIKTFNESSDENTPLLSLWKDEEEDTRFVINLFRQSVIHSKDYEKLIGDKTDNWEMDRISMMDVLLMKMSIAEIINFPSIPINVSINEYIDISKDYSTEQSGTFINGILDKIIEDLKTDNKIMKIGKGLM